ncbi:cation-transporting P-type ATPase [Nonomuraea rosea]|uniref:Cation-transporting P-type ATPase n=1 Tax=Nonomuraea rosea TaxID=638574 RepID=A0ABP6ZIZ9_9ACTN
MFNSGSWQNVLLPFWLTGNSARGSPKWPQTPLLSAIFLTGVLAAWAGDLCAALAIVAVAAMGILHIWVLEKRIAAALTALGLPPVVHTPLIQAIGRFRSMALLVALAGAVAVLVAAQVLGLDASAARTTSAALLVVAVPWELPSVVAAALATGAVRMAGHQAIVRRAAAVEMLGATTVVITRRSGLLTQDRLGVTAVVAGGHSYEVTGPAGREGEIRREGVRMTPGRDLALDECLRAGIACNDARVLNGEGPWLLTGGPEERALLISARKLGLEQVPDRVATLPFTPERRFMATLHRPGAGELATAYAKGAVERILYLCDTELCPDGSVRVLDREAILTAAQTMTRRGLRVLAFAYAPERRQADGLTERSLRPMIFLGLQAMYAPVLPDALDAVRGCEEAGVQVKIITGADVTTARLSAAWVGLEGATAIGAQFAAHDPAGAPEAGLATVFARMLPAEEQRLVQALRRRKQVVTVVDGNAGGGARRQADTGIGTRITDQAADVIVPGGTFATAVSGIAEGRAALDNAARSTASSLAPRALALVLVVAMMGDVTAPMTPLNLLWLNLVTVMILMIALSFVLRTPESARTPARGAIRRPLVAARLVEALIVAALLACGACALFAWARAGGESLAEARTATTVATSFVVLAHTSVSLLFARPQRRRAAARDHRAMISLFALVALQPALVYVPALNDLFATVPLSGAIWPAILAEVAITWGLLMLVTTVPRGRAGKAAGGVIRGG